MTAPTFEKDYVEEECLVYLDFDTKLSDEKTENQNLKIKFLGIDSEHPVVQVNNKIYKGLSICWLHYAIWH